MIQNQPVLKLEVLLIRAHGVIWEALSKEAEVEVRMQVEAEAIRRQLLLDLDHLLYTECRREAGPQSQKDVVESSPCLSTLKR